MKKRAITSIFIVLVVGLAVASMIWLKEVFDIFVAMICVISASEVCNMLAKKEKPHNRFMACMYIAILYVPVIFAEDSTVSIGELFLWLFVAYLAWSALALVVEMILAIKNKQEIKTSFVSTFNTMLVGIYPALLLSMFFIIGHLDGYLYIPNKYTSLWLVVMIFAITMLSDTFAYLVGSTLKGPKVCPKISPNKSWSGCIGGLIGGAVGALAIWGICHVNAFESILTTLNMNVWAFIGVGIIGSVISQIGDFFESYLKRKTGIKDSGNLFPGHGGMLDRIDALMFNLLFITIFVVLVI